MAQNMYRVGDYVYFETFSSVPYQIRRIEELSKTVSGAVEIKVTCFFRRRDLPVSLLRIADQAERQNKILSKPRKTLISKNEPATSTTTTSNGKGDPSENGIEQIEENAISEKGTEENKEREEEENEEKKTLQNQHNDENQIQNCGSFAGLPSGAERLDPSQLNEIRQHELFLSRIVETLPANQIRGKCAVVILNEMETCNMYLGQEDTFFYSLVYDPSNHTLLADKGRIEIGERHQAEIPELITENVKAEGAKENDQMEEMKERQKGQHQDGIQLTDREFVVYHPHHDLTDRDIDQFLIIARAVGTFSRALDSSSSTKLTTLHQTASVASRDITLLHAMALLHQANYDLGQATKFLVPPPDKLHYPLEADKVTSHNTVSLGGPILCRDQLEEWSAAESTLFEDAIEKYGKDFHDVRLDCLPWKSMRDIVEYYYMWKTTSRYSELQKAKHAEQENKLKQVYIPNHNKASPNLISSQHGLQMKIPCESCETDYDSTTTQWYSWGPAHEQFRLCGNCWMVWKKRGGLKRTHEFDKHDLDGAADARSANVNRMGIGRNGLAPSTLKGAQLLGQKGRVAFYLNSTLEARIARRMAPKQIFNVRKAARSPFREINVKGLQEYYFSRPIAEILHTAHQVKRGTISKVGEMYLTKLHEKQPSWGGTAQNGGGNRRS